MLLAKQPCSYQLGEVDFKLVCSSDTLHLSCVGWDYVWSFWVCFFSCSVLHESARWPRWFSDEEESTITAAPWNGEKAIFAFAVPGFMDVPAAETEWV